MKGLYEYIVSCLYEYIVKGLYGYIVYCLYEYIVKGLYGYIVKGFYEYIVTNYFIISTWARIRVSNKNDDILL